ncbi:MAG: HAD family phosphatase [Anaerolineaceae bacterium]
MSVRAVIFDLDGTLVQTEKIKAHSYAKALQEISPDVIQEEDVIEVYKSLVGLSRADVASGLLVGFNLEKAAGTRMAEFEVTTPWQAFVQIRLKYYEELILDAQIIQENTWPYTMSLLGDVRRKGYKLDLATMSYCPQVNHILGALNLRDTFHFVASRDDVEHGKPDPEIYQLVAKVLGIPAGECLVIEDSPGGVKSALAAGMRVIAVPTQFTKTAFQQTSILDSRWVVHDPSLLQTVFNEITYGIESGAF